MSEKYTSDRIIFPKSGDQTKFLLCVKKELDVTWDDLGKIVDRNSRTLRSWARERNRMTFTAAKNLAKKAKINLPVDIVRENWEDHVSRAGKIGGRALVEKNGGRVASNEDYRKQKWLEWWNNIGQYEDRGIDNKPRLIRKPRKSSKLAEFAGIILGDGGISDYQVVVTLHREDDKKYSKFVRKLIFELFDVTAGEHIKKEALADNIVVSRIELVRFCLERVGLKTGNKVKQQVDIPDWIKNNRRFYCACVRGLIDTDGSVFTHKYEVKGKEYRYKKLSFTSMSKPLRKSVYTFLKSIGLSPRYGVKGSVWLDSQTDMEHYFIQVGTHNPKHLKRYKE